MAGALASTLVFLALAGVAAQGQFFDVDTGVQGLVHRVQNPALGLGMRAVSTLGDSAGLLPLIAVVSGLAWRIRRRYILIVPLVMIGTGVLQHVAKSAVARPRPNLAPLGFPSGHVLSLVVLLGLGCYLLVVLDARRRWRYLGVAVSSTALLVVVASRLYLEAHWLSDVLGGFVVGLAYLLVVILILEALPAPVPRPGSEQSAIPAA
jgi:membrane-associated phospholipid phosphatase